MYTIFERRSDLNEARWNKRITPLENRLSQ
jgi:hypothetical protein